MVIIGLKDTTATPTRTNQTTITQLSSNKDDSIGSQEDLSIIDQLYASIRESWARDQQRHASISSQQSSTLVDVAASMPRRSSTPAVHFTTTNSTDSGSDRSSPAIVSSANGGDVSATSVVRVYAAYECGLARGASVRLAITNTTTANSIVAIVVMQLHVSGAHVC
jgi:hypothetical protein